MGGLSRVDHDCPTGMHCHAGKRFDQSSLCGTLCLYPQPFIIVDSHCHPQPFIFVAIICGFVNWADTTMSYYNFCKLSWYHNVILWCLMSHFAWWVVSGAIIRGFVNCPTGMHCHAGNKFDQSSLCGTLCLYPHSLLLLFPDFTDFWLGTGILLVCHEFPGPCYGYSFLGQPKKNKS